MTPKFITFEGGEGFGKSTQVKHLSEWLKSKGLAVTTTREPGGTPDAEAVRALLVNGQTDKWSPEAEALLNYAARDSHIKAVINPALARGEFVICDRFMDSTRAYQHYAGGCAAELIDTLERNILNSLRPSLTVVMDGEPSLGLARVSMRGNGAEDRFERKGQGFHERLRRGFLEIARTNPERCVVVDASKSVDEIVQKVRDYATKVFHV
jgi:dTMP kinase